MVGVFPNEESLLRLVGSILMDLNEERVNRELKRRTKVVGVFPNEESLLRLVGSILMDINEEWVTGRRYLTMEKE